MALSAFKSTTKRVCSIGPSNEQPESASVVPNSSFNKRSYRRTRSFSELNSRYFSDSASAAGDSNSIRLDSFFQRGQVSTRHQSDESESDVDSVYSRRTFRSHAEIGATGRAVWQNGKTKGTTQAELRRSMTQSETSHKEIADFLSCIDDQSDTESVVIRTSSRSHRGYAQSDSESVFSRLTRPRQTVEVGPLRTQVRQDGKAKGVRAGALRRSTSQMDLSGSYPNRDDQSETESLYSRRTYRSRQNADFGGSRIATTRKKGTRQAALRRSRSQIELSDATVGGFREPSPQQDDGESPDDVYYDMELRRRDEEAFSDHPEEEKTIRAVHTENKEPRSHELDAISLYDAMRVEMRKAVADIRNEIEQKSLNKDLALPTRSLPEGFNFAVPGEADDNDSTVAEVRRSYAAKLEESEKRAQELWTQLAAEERRCLDLVKFVKELLPAQPGFHSKLRAPPQVMGPEVEKQLVSKSLDADAQRYFDECVSISGLSIMSVNDASSCGVGYQESEGPAWSVKDVSISPRKNRSNEKKMTMLEPLITFCAQIEQTGKCSSKSSNLFARAAVNDDGLLLPWLKWETDLDFSFQEQLGKDKYKDGTLTGSIRGQTLARSRSATWRDSRQLSKEEQETQFLGLPPGVLGLGCATNGDLSSCKSVDFGYLRSVAISSTQQSEGFFDVEMFVLQRMWLRHRIKDGRILICGGIRS